MNFKLALPLFARMLSERLKVKIVWGASEPCTDGNSIMLPDLPLDSAVDRDLLLGYVTHECGHISHTDFQTVECELEPGSLEFGIWNYIEDIWIEKETIKSYPGCAPILNNVVSRLVETGEFANPTQLETDRDFIEAYMCYFGRSMLLNQTALHAYLQPLEEKLAKQFSPKFVDDLRSYVKQVGSSHTTFDNIEIARKIVALFPQEVAKQPSKSQDMSSMIKSAFNENTSSAQGRRNPVKMPIEKPILLAYEGANLLMSARSSTHALRRKFELLFENSALNHTYYAKAQGKVVPTRVWRLRYGDSRVFQRTDEGEKPSTAVVLLLDKSSSMRNRIQLAVEATLAMCMSLKKLENVKAAAAAFPMGSSEEDSRVIGVLTDFDERVEATASRYASITANGNTPTPTALIWAMSKLLDQDADHKIIFVQTDGAPDCMEQHKELLKVASGLGINVYGVGILTDVADSFDKQIHVSSMDQLAPAVFNLLTNELKVGMAA